MTATAPTVRFPRARVPLWRRVYGLGSIYAKTIRDSRLAFIIVAGLLAGLMLGVGAGFAAAFSTEEARAGIARLVADLPPILQGISGKALNVDTLGGYMTFKYGPYFALMAGTWSILALSGTLAGEAKRGSLDFVAAAPFGKRQIALEKLGAHLTMMALAMAILSLAVWITGSAFGTLPGDEIPASAAIAYGLGVGLLALASGGVAFALAPLVGRGGAAGIAACVMVGGFLLDGYQASVPAFRGFANLTWFGWSSQHLPLSGQSDWPSLVPVAIAAIVLFAVGVELFVRRDLGASSSLRLPGLPAAVLGVRGPIGRSFGERLPAALAWGIGLGVFAFVMAAASTSLADELDRLAPETQQLLRTALPHIDLTTAGGFLQLVFIELGFIIIGFAAVMLVAGWGSDETSGRLDLLLSTPLSRWAWAVRSGIGVFVAIALMTVVIAVGVGLGAALAGSDVVIPMVGSITLGLYAIALAGIGFAIGGAFRTSIAAEAVAAIVVGTFLIGLIGPALDWPDPILQLSLTSHLGQPMVGEWDAVGVIACLAIAAAGLLLGGFGVTRRDIGQ